MNDKNNNGQKIGQKSGGSGVRVVGVWGGVPQIYKNHISSMRFFSDFAIFLNVDS